jgi:hypothetical protein
MIVVLVVDDIDSHGSECGCGLCNRNGRSYGCGIFKADDRDGDPLERVYGPSDEAAIHNARKLCEEKDWKEAVHKE